MFETFVLQTNSYDIFFIRSCFADLEVAFMHFESRFMDFESCFMDLLEMEDEQANDRRE